MRRLGNRLSGDSDRSKQIFLSEVFSWYKFYSWKVLSVPMMRLSWRLKLEFLFLRLCNYRSSSNGSADLVLTTIWWLHSQWFKIVTLCFSFVLFEMNNFIILIWVWCTKKSIWYCVVCYCDLNCNIHILPTFSTIDYELIKMWQT